MINYYSITRAQCQYIKVKKKRRTKAKGVEREVERKDRKEWKTGGGI